MQVPVVSVTLRVKRQFNMAKHDEAVYTFSKIYMYIYAKIIIVHVIIGLHIPFRPFKLV